MSRPPGSWERRLHPPAEVFRLLAHLLRTSPHSAGTHSLALIDIDGLTRINRTHGRSTGDALLSHVSETLATSMRRGERAARWAGDQYVIVLPDVGRSEGTRRVSAMLASLPARRDPGMSTVEVSASAGGATYPSNGTDNISLLDAAAAALHEAKRQGGDQVIWA